MPLYFLLAAALVAVDQVVKYLVRAGIPLHTAVDFLPRSGPDLCAEHRRGPFPCSASTPGCSPSCPGWCPWFW